MTHEIVEVFNTSPEISWLPWAVQYSFVIAISYGAFFLSLPGLVLHKKGWEVFSRVSLVIAVATGLCAPLTLMADLHQPGRFVNFFLHFQPGSWMSWGAIFLPLYALALLLFARQSMAVELQHTASGTGLMAGIARIVGPKGLPSACSVRLASWFGVGMALLVMVYSGAEMMVVAARPMWHSLFMPVALALSGLVAAGALALAITAFTNVQKEKSLPSPLRFLVASQFILFILLGLWWFAGGGGLSPSLGRAYAEFLNFAFLRSMALCFVSQLGLGFVLSLVLVQRRSTCPWCISAVAFFTLGGAFALRWMLFIGAQQISRMGAGYTDYALPLGYNGLWGMVGTVGLLVGIMILLTALLPAASGPKNNSHTAKGARHEC